MSYVVVPPPPHSPWPRLAGKVIFDGLLAGLAFALTFPLFPSWPHHIALLAGWSAFGIALSLSFQMFRQHYRFIGFQDMLRVLVATLSLLLASFLVHLMQFFPDMRGSAWIIAGLLTGLFWAGARAFFRLVPEAQENWGTSKGQRTLIIGAGRAGLLVAEELGRHKELGCEVIGFLDDDLAKQGVRMRGIPVLGTQELMRNLVSTLEIDQIILAIPSATGPEIRRLADRARNANVIVKTVPGIFNLLGSHPWKPELRDVSIEDLLRREPIYLDQSSLSTVIEDRVVLITGAGGSIGSELARQICCFRPSRLILLGRGENSLWSIERELKEAFPNQPLTLELCDIRNRRRLFQAFERRRPEVVFHAAAHKHVPFLELHPEEAVENNIFGTQNVLDACMAQEVPHMVNISTDKAVNPTNILGASKQVAEMLVAKAAALLGTQHRYVTVRFGNVLGSRGSVVPIFKEQIMKGGPITITDKEMTRYFMTIPEASQLVIQAGLLGTSGKVYVLDMGEPVRIVDLATDLIHLSGLVPFEDIEIRYTGLRPGEKLYEELFHGESHASPIHPKAFEAHQKSINSLEFEKQLEALAKALDLPLKMRVPRLVRLLQDLVPGYTPSPTGAGRWIQPISSGLSLHPAQPGATPAMEIAFTEGGS